MKSMNAKSKRRKPRMLAPCECNTERKVCELNRSWTQVGNFEIHTDGDMVSLYESVGGNTLSGFSLRPESLNALIQWWQKKQTVRK